jgi:hypothetical protein
MDFKGIRDQMLPQDLPVDDLSTTEVKAIVNEIQHLSSSHGGFPILKLKLPSLHNGIGNLDFVLVGLHAKSQG